MNEQRKNEIREEAERRVKLWVENTSFAEMTVNGSFVRFNMAVGALGYPFHYRDWMNADDFKSFVSTEEFETPEYDDIIRDLFDKYYDLKFSHDKINGEKFNITISNYDTFEEDFKNSENSARYLSANEMYESLKSMVMNDYAESLSIYAVQMVSYQRDESFDGEVMFLLQSAKRNKTGWVIKYSYECVSK